MTEAVLESGTDLARYETWAHPEFSEADGREYAGYWDEAWAAGSAYYFAVFGEAVYQGSCGLSGISREHGTAALGFWVRSGATRRGVATSSGRLVAAFGFEHIGLHRIEIMSAVDNAASRRVAAKLGAVEEGVLRKRLTLGGVPTDAALLAIVH